MKELARPRVLAQRGRLGELAGATRWQPLLEWALQPDGAERVDPQPPRGPRPRAPGESAWRRHLEVGRFPALPFGAVTQEDEGLGVLGSLGTRGHPDRRFFANVLITRRSAMATATRRLRGGDGEHGRRPGLDRQSPRQGARSDARLSSMARRHSAKRSTPSLAAAIQRCHHKGRFMRASGAPQAWDQDDAKAERRNLWPRAASWWGWTRSSPSSASAARTPALARLHQHSRTRSACARSPATSNAGDTPFRQMDRRRGPENLSPQGLRQLILRNALQEHLRKAQADSAIETIMKAA